MIKRLTALLLSICLLLSAAPVYAGAATGQRVYANAVTVTAGNSAAVTLYAEKFSNVAAMDVYIYYDAAVLTVSGTYSGYMLSGTQTSVNASDAGTIKLSAMALNGISGTGELLTVYFETKYNCTPGVYPIAVAVGRAYDTDLAEAAIYSANGSVTVEERVETEMFFLYGYRDQYYLKKDDVLTYTVRNDWIQAFVSGEFVVEYDHELFSFDSVTLWPELKGEGAVYSVNSSVLGQVRIAYANDDPVTAFELFSVKLRVIADTDAYTTLKATASNMYRADLTAYLPGSTSTDVRVEKLPEVVDHPNVFLKTERLVAGEQSKSVFYLEEGAGVAAADFSIVYDATALRCVDVKVCDGVDALGGMVIINENFTAGTIRFSYINMDAYSETELPLVEIIWEPISSPENHHQTRIGGVGVVDIDQNPVSLEYVTDSGCIFIPKVVAPTCLLDGYTDHNCACGENFQTEPTEKLGHDIQKFPPQEATCTEIGWDAYEGCSRCDYGTYVEIPALGHDVVHHEAQVQTCLGIGWAAYETCNRCDYSTYQELPALGHDLTYHEGKQATCTESGWNAYETCSRCDYTTYQGIPALGHDWQLSGPQAPTCTVDGYEVNGYCSRCNAIAYVGIPALGHNLTCHAGKQATCTEIGWNAYETCSRCDYSTYQELPALGHDATHHKEKAATCTEIGWNAYETCSRCDYTTYQEIPALMHNYDVRFDWNGDHTACEAMFICLRACGEEEAVVCAVSEGTTDPAKTVHTAVANYSDMQATDSISCQNYVITFKNWDGSLLSSYYCHLNRTVTVPAEPTKAEDDIYTYSFAGWDKEVVACAGDATYIATYTSVKKPIVFVESNGAQQGYGTLAEAEENAPAGSTLKLIKTIEEAVTVNKELTIDLNGFDLTGDIVIDGGKLLLKDSQTDDYTIEDEAGYGKLTGTVTGVQAAEGYMLIAGEEGISFHRIDLDIHTMTLRSSAVGVYYQSDFAGDELVAQNVSHYGVALSVYGEPTENSPSILSWFGDFQAGSNAANGTLLHGIMKYANSEEENATNAELPVFGRAYILTRDGRYIFGESVSRSLRQQVEAIDSRWNTLTAQQQTELLEMYALYRSVMENWNIPNIKSK